VQWRHCAKASLHQSVNAPKRHGTKEALQQSVMTQCAKASLQLPVIACIGALAQWRFGAMTLRCNDALAHWCHDALVQWRFGAMPLWCNDVIAPKRHCTKVSMHQSVMAPKRHCTKASMRAMTRSCNDALAHWCHDALVHWCHGALVQWCLGTWRFGSMMLWHYDT